MWWSIGKSIFWIWLIRTVTVSYTHLEAGIYQLRQYATDEDIPIDGIVVSFNDIAYAQSCGRTGHHYIIIWVTSL